MCRTRGSIAVPLDSQAIRYRQSYSAWQDQICKWVFENIVICKKVVSKGWCKESRDFIFVWIFVILARACLNACLSWNFAQIRPLTMELSALEHLKNRHITCGQSSSFIFDWIFLILAGNKNMLKSLNWFQSVFRISISVRSDN